MLILFVTLSVVFFLTTLLMVVKYIILGKIVLKIEKTIEDCLDVIDNKYETMTEILKRPLFFDSPEVRSVVMDLKSVKDSLHAIALSLSENISTGESDDNEENKDS